MGNLKFVYSITSEFTDRYTIDGTQKSGDKTSDGTDIYIGDDADAPNLGFLIAAAYYPSLSQYVAVAQTALTDVEYAYVFTITDSGGLRGCWHAIISGTSFDCFALEEVSQRFPLNVWARTRLLKSEQGDRFFEMEALGKMRLSDSARLNSNRDRFQELRDALEKRSETQRDK